MIDIHCHILPHLDDGPSTLDTALHMAAIAAGDGIRSIIATPHTDGFRVDATRVHKAVGRLNDALQKNDIEVEIITGYEIPSFLLDRLALTHTLAQSRYVLLEFPHTHLPADAQITISTVRGLGLYPIIAHPERNPDVIVSPNRLRELVAAGALVQLTAASVVGAIDLEVERCSHYLLQNHLAHFIATDSHSPSFRRPVLQEARRTAVRLVGAEKADNLVHANGLHILRNKRIVPYD